MNEVSYENKSFPHNETQNQQIPQQQISCTKEGELALLSSAILEMKDNLRDMKDLLTSNASLEERTEELRRSVKDLSGRLHSIELTIAETLGSHKWIDKIIFAIVGAGLALLFSFGLKGGAGIGGM